MVQALALLALCLSLSLARAFADEDLPEAPSAPEMPEVGKAPADVQERSVPQLAKEHGLSPKEELILLPLLNELAVRRRALQAVWWQRTIYRQSVTAKKYYFNSGWRRIDMVGLASIRRHNALQLDLLEMWRSAIGIIPNMPNQKVWRPSPHPFSVVNWMDPKDLPGKLAAEANAGQQRVQRWVKGDYTFDLTWLGPGMAFDWTNGKRCKLESERLEQESLDLQQSNASKTYAISYPVLGWVKRAQLQADIARINQRITELKTQIANGTLVLTSDAEPGRVQLVAPVVARFPEDLIGWVTKKEVQDKIADLLAKRRGIQAQYEKGELKVFRNHTGRVSRLELDKSIHAIKAKAEILSDQVRSGDYPAYFPGEDVRHTLKSVEQKLQQVAARMRFVRADPDYRCPVNLYGMRSRGEIEVLLRSKNLTPDRRAALQLGLKNLPLARALEIRDLGRRQTYFRFLKEMLTPFQLTYSSVTGSCIHDTLPRFLHYQWDCSHRESLRRVVFTQDRDYYLHFYNVRIAHLTRLLPLFK